MTSPRASNVCGPVPETDTFLTVCFQDSNYFHPSKSYFTSRFSKFHMEQKCDLDFLWFVSFILYHCHHNCWVTYTALMIHQVFLMNCLWTEALLVCKSVRRLWHVNATSEVGSQLCTSDPILLFPVDLQRVFAASRKKGALPIFSPAIDLPSLPWHCCWRSLFPSSCISGTSV